MSPEALVVATGIIVIITWILHGKHSPLSQVDGGLSEGLLLMAFMIIFELGTGFFGLWLIFFDNHWAVGLCLTSYLLRWIYLLLFFGWPEKRKTYF